MKQFTYSNLNTDDRQYVQSRVVTIRAASKRVVEDVILIGRSLAETKDRIPHGSWEAWLQAEFKWSAQSALNFMQVYQLSKNQKFRCLPALNVDISVLYLLARPSTSEAVKTKVVEMAKTQYVTHADAVAIQKEHQHNDAPPSGDAQGWTDQDSLQSWIEALDELRSITNFAQFDAGKIVWLATQRDRAEDLIGGVGQMADLLKAVSIGLKPQLQLVVNHATK